MKKIIPLLLALMGLSFGSAYAAEQNGVPYVGVQAGIGGMDTPTVDGISYELRSGVSYHLYGGYLFNINPQFKIGPEVGYTGYPDNKYGILSDNDTVYSGYYVDLLANASYFFNEHWSLIGKAGFAYTTQKLTIDYGSLAGIPDSKTNASALPELVLGVAYQLDPQMSLNLTYNAVFGNSMSQTDIGDTTSSSVASVHTFMFGFNYAFA